jgi:hypothetical protein
LKNKRTPGEQQQNRTPKSSSRKQTGSEVSSAGSARPLLVSAAGPFVLGRCSPEAVAPCPATTSKGIVTGAHVKQDRLDRLQRLAVPSSLLCFLPAAP